MREVRGTRERFDAVKDFDVVVLGDDLGALLIAALTQAQGYRTALVARVNWLEDPQAGLLASPSPGCLAASASWKRALQACGLTETQSAHGDGTRIAFPDARWAFEDGKLRCEGWFGIPTPKEREVLLPAHAAQSRPEVRRRELWKHWLGALKAPRREHDTREAAIDGSARQLLLALSYMDEVADHVTLPGAAPPYAFMGNAGGGHYALNLAAQLAQQLERNGAHLALGDRASAVTLNKHGTEVLSAKGARYHTRHLVCPPAMHTFLGLLSCEPKLRHQLARIGFPQASTCPSGFLLQAPQLAEACAGQTLLTILAPHAPLANANLLRIRPCGEAQVALDFQVAQAALEPNASLPQGIQRRLSAHCRQYFPFLETKTLKALQDNTERSRPAGARFKYPRVSLEGYGLPVSLDGARLLSAPMHVAPGLGSEGLPVGALTLLAELGRAGHHPQSFRLGSWTPPSKTA